MLFSLSLLPALSFSRLLSSALSHSHVGNEAGDPPTARPSVRDPRLALILRAQRTSRTQPLDLNGSF